MNSNQEQGKLPQLTDNSRLLANLVIEQAERHGFDVETDAIREAVEQFCKFHSIDATEAERVAACEEAERQWAQRKLPEDGRSIPEQVAYSVAFAKRGGFNPGELTAMGRSNLEQAGLPIKFESWLTLIAVKLGGRVNPRRYALHWVDGRTIDEAIELVEADALARQIAGATLRRCGEARAEIATSHSRYLEQYIAERVVHEMQKCI